MKKWIWAMGFVLSAALALSACGKTGEGNSETKASGPIKEFTIQAKNYEFDLKEIKVNKGDITLKNSLGMHAVKFEGYDKEVKGDKTISFVADKTGEFDYACAIFCGTGHDDRKANCGIGRGVV